MSEPRTSLTIRRRYEPQGLPATENAAAAGQALIVAVVVAVCIAGLLGVLR